jgi:AAA ATPase domain
MATTLPDEQLRGRQREREALDRLLQAARGGDGRALVVHGEPGVGKTALLDHAVEVGREFRVARTLSVEGEMELAFAALQQLCSPFLELREGLPQPQRDALGVAFGLAAGPAPNPFLVGLAVLGLLSEAGGGAATALRRRRRAVARGPSPAGGENRACVRGPRARGPLDVTSRTQLARRVR